MRLSVIIPVYNVAPWIERCINSVLAQNLSCDDYEIILINDASTDNSMDVVQNVLKKMSASKRLSVNIRIVEHEKNQGLAAARNTGLEVANGQYIWWIDSDDEIEPNIAGYLLDKAECHNLEVLCFGLKMIEESTGKESSFLIPDESEGSVMVGEEFVLKVGFPVMAWCALYRRDYLIAQNLRFMNGIIHEDQEFTVRAYLLSERIAFDNTVAYRYYQRNGSIMKSRNPKKTTDLIKICNSLWSFTENWVKDSTVKQFMVNRISFIFSQALRNHALCGNGKFPYSKDEMPYYPLQINNGLPIKECVKYRLINMSINIYTKVYGLVLSF